MEERNWTMMTAEAVDVRGYFSEEQIEKLGRNRWERMMRLARTHLAYERRTNLDS